MRVGCPHCNAAYNIDDRRVPAAGVKVKCPKCQSTFPVRRVDAGDDATAVPLPGAAEAAGIPLPSPVAFGGIPLPPPPAFAGAGIPLPPPAFPDTAPDSPFGAADPFGAPPPAPDDSPFASGAFPQGAAADAPFAEPDAVFDAPAAALPIGFGEVDFGAGPMPSEPLPAAVDDAAIEFDPPPAAAPSPFPPLGVDPLPVPTGLDPFGAADASFPPPSPPLPSSRAPGASGTGEELEMLFGDAAPPPKPAAVMAAEPPEVAAEGEAAGFKIRRRSGKTFGPFTEAQIVEMLGKGELMGNEDVSADGATFEPIGAMPAFAEAIRSATAENAPTSPTRGLSQRVAAFGDRMAATKIVDGEAGGAGRARWVKLAIAAAALAAVLGVGLGAGLTRHGVFFWRMFRPVDAALVARSIADARAALARGDYPSERAGLQAAARAVAADPDSAEAAMVHAMAVAALEQRHAAQPDELAQAQVAVARLEEDHKGEPAALAARLAVTLAATPDATLPLEQALEARTARDKPDSEVIALLGRAALARGDLAKGEAQLVKLAAADSGPRAPVGLAAVLRARGKLAEARAGLEKALAKTPDHLPLQIELAAVLEAVGDVEGATARLAPALADAAKAKLAPADRARALGLQGALVARRRAAAADADALFRAAVAADPRSTEARLALARHRLRVGDPAGAVAATDPVVPGQTLPAELTALRIRALALAGRALDASLLATQALGAAPGTPALLLARAVALAASGKVEDAKAAYTEALARDPSAVEPRVALGRLALAQNDLAKAAEQLAAAVEKGPRDPAAHAALGDLEAAKGDAAAAEAAYRKALELDPEAAAAEVGLARLALARGDAAGAKASLARALAVEPRNPEANLARGGLLWAGRDLAGAEDAFANVVEVKPRDALALTRLGAVRLERGSLDPAVKALTAATTEDEKLAETRLWLGRALLAKGEIPAAIAQLNKAVTLAPADPQMHLQLGAALERSGSLPEALDAYRAAAAAGPTLTEPHERIGALFAANGHCDEAIPAYEKALQLAPRSSRTRLSLGECKAKLGKHDEAAKVYREVMKADPSAVQVYYLLARSVHEAEGPKAALPWYERAAKEEKANAMPHYYLAYAYKERGQKQRAIAEFKTFLARRPEAPERKDIEAEIEDLGGSVGR